MSHWLSQRQDWAPFDTFITEADIKLIAQMGFDHVRLPVDEEVVWTIDGEIIEDKFKYVLKCIDWCDKFGLRVVFDLHILRSHHFNAVNGEGAMTLWSNPADQEKFLLLWDTVCGKLKHVSNDLLAYELMNEPVAPDHAQWNTLLASCIARVRSHEPLRTIIAGSNMWQKSDTYPYFEVPENDKHLILSFHTYEPLLVTHYKAYWLQSKDYEGLIQYPGMSIDRSWLSSYQDGEHEPMLKMIAEANGKYDRDILEKLFLLPITKARKLGLPLYCSEFGCLPTMDAPIRQRYFRDVVGLFRKHSISFAVWDYKGDFGLVKWDRKLKKNAHHDQMVLDILR